MSAGSGKARHAVEGLLRAGGGSLRQADEETLERLRSYVRWLYAVSYSDERDKWAVQAAEMLEDLAAGDVLGEARLRFRIRADDYYQRLGGEVVRRDLPAGRRLWIVCYQLGMLWVRIDYRKAREKSG